jgi:hypothetical protein
VSAGGQRIVRNQVVQRWGTPHETIGSVNEPRTLVEHGVVANEKWIYRGVGGEPARPRQRLVYWHRYDFVASFLIEPDGTVTREDTPAILAGTHDRLYRRAEDAV